MSPKHFLFLAILVITPLAHAQDKPATTKKSVDLIPQETEPKQEDYSAGVELYQHREKLMAEKKHQALINKHKEDFSEEDFTNGGKFQAINKTTARVSAIETPVGKVNEFRNLEIKLHKCWHAPPEANPENKGLLQIWERLDEETKKEIFHGWMFSSSPSLSALEHPVYDITLLECKNIAQAPELPKE